MTDTRPAKSPFHLDENDSAASSRWSGVMASIIHEVSDRLPTTGVLAVGLSQAWKLVVPGNSLMFTAGVLVGCLIGAKAGVERWDLETRTAKLFESPETREIVAKIAAMSDDVTSVRKGKIWLVKQATDDVPVVMDDVAYKDFKKQLAAEDRQLDEMSIDDKGVTVRRFVGDKLDAGDRTMPALERFEFKDGNIEAVVAGWFSKGRKVTPEMTKDGSQQPRDAVYLV